VSTAIAFTRANPVVGAMLGALAIVVVVFGISAIVMTRAGLSLRLLAFMAGFLAIVGGPQVAFHFSQALGVIPKRDPTWTFGKDRVSAAYARAPVGHCRSACHRDHVLLQGVRRARPFRAQAVVQLFAQPAGDEGAVHLGCD
jgi:hypothetical protein